MRLLRKSQVANYTRSLHLKDDEKDTNKAVNQDPTAG